jgi:voltage-gated potassium channel
MAGEKPFEELHPIRPGERVLRRRRGPRRRLRLVPNVPGVVRFLGVIFTQTPFLQMLLLFIVLWLLFSLGVYFADRDASGTTINSYGDALYCQVAAFSTSGIADMPVTAPGKVFVGLWMALGSLLFFGTIVATVTTYYMLPRTRPSRQIISTIQYNLEKLEDLSLEELVTLKDITDRLIDAQMGKVKPK